MPEAFDWDILHRPSAMAMVRGQLGFSWMVLSGRLAQLTDEQYFWRPSSEAISVVRRHHAGRYRSLGSGEWVAQWPEEPDHRGPRTIAWLIAHLTETFFERWEWTFGASVQAGAEITLHGNARDAVAWLTYWVEAWQDAIAGLDEDAAMTIGLSQANELDAAEPFGHVVLRLNRELIHHGSEIMTLQDLYAVAA
ncbi:DinB family protein [Kribbella speibonae]|uniref:DinB family protein n=1 Tax=Kribbella speibonae TaxID=1572660 RepID=A0A4R0IZJ8_9ACTN|nr:DinB family protein [Kribbella speibonae]TCC34265.1 DinB family protein [Kribbella speibonae]